MFCPNCGSQNKDDAQFCENCGSKLDNVVTQETPTSKIPDPAESKKPSTILVILGYIFAILGGLIGIVIGLYLYTRDNSEAKFHGRNMLVIAAIIIILGLVVNAFVLSTLTTTTTSLPSSSDSSTSTPSSTSSSSSGASGSVTLVINYPGEWSGAIADSSGTRSIEGTGSKTIDLGNIDGAVAANAHKRDSGSQTMTISLTKGGTTLETQSTSSEYGFVSVSHYID